MKKLLLITLLTLNFLEADSPSIQLIGLDVDGSAFAQNSYTTMYDNQDDPNYKKRYISNLTIGVFRENNHVEVHMLDYLLVPTAKGFKYVTNAVTEEKLRPYVKENKDDDYDRAFEKEYDLESSITKPRFFNSKKSIEKFMKKQKPSFDDAISIEYENISFINPNFYITKGFESEVHGGASWFNATEKVDYYPINRTKKFKNFSSKLLNYLSRKEVNKIIVKVACTKNYIAEKNCNEDTTLPWGSSISEHEEVYFSFDFLYNQLYLQPYVLLNGNSSRSFLAQGEPIKQVKVNKKFGLKVTDQEAKLYFSKYAFLSPDGKTRVEIDKGKLTVTNVADSKLLYSKPFPRFSKIVMSEWATGRYAKKWLGEFSFAKKL